MWGDDDIFHAAWCDVSPNGLEQVKEKKPEENTKKCF